MIQALILVIIYFAGSIEIWQIFILSIMMGCINAFDIPARHSFVIDMVEKKDLGNAIALNSLMFNGAMLIGPSIAGVLLAVEGEGICFLINVFSYLFVIISLYMMNNIPCVPLKQRSNIFKDMKDGFKYTFGFPPIKYIILFLALVNLLAVPYTLLLPAFAKEILQGGSNTYGFLIGSSGFGALLAALYLASVKTPLRMGNIIPWSASIFGIGLILFSFTHFPILSFILMIAVGFGDMLHTSASNTMLQNITDDDKRGRVMSIYTMSIVGIAPFGSLLIGELAKSLGTTITILIGGAACIIGALIFLRKLPDLKKLVFPVYNNLSFFNKVNAGIQTDPGNLINATYKLKSL
jgi:MFS family permease